MNVTLRTQTQTGSQTDTVSAILARLPGGTLARHTPPAFVGAERKRTPIWNLHRNLHCSVIGTCLSTAELRQVLGRTALGRPDMSEHDLHLEGVRLAARADAAGKILNKALDQRHRLATKAAAAATSEAALTEFWRLGAKAGDIPGTYWATLSHPFATEALVKRAFGEVHMLSHLVGSANRADLRRLCQLEAEKTALEDKLARQQTQLREAILSREATIRDLRATLVGRVTATQAPEVASSILEGCLADLEQRLASEIGRRERLAQRQEHATQALAQEQRARQALERQLAAMAEELRAMETLLNPAEAPPPAALDGQTLLYVGARPNQVPGLRALAEERGAAFLHHDGGVEEASSLLAGLVARADLVLFPVDCISHDAALNLKRQCRQLGKRYIHLRTASLSSLASELARL